MTPESLKDIVKKTEKERKTALYKEYGPIQEKRLDAQEIIDRGDIGRDKAKKTLNFFGI